MYFPISSLAPRQRKNDARGFVISFLFNLDIPRLKMPALRYQASILSLQCESLRTKKIKASLKDKEEIKNEMTIISPTEKYKWSDIIIDCKEEERISQANVQAILWALSIEKVKTVTRFIAR